jgi:hypothetical protein
MTWPECSPLDYLVESDALPVVLSRDYVMTWPESVDPGTGSARGQKWRSKAELRNWADDVVHAVLTWDRMLTWDRLARDSQLSRDRM